MFILTVLMMMNKTIMTLLLLLFTSVFAQEDPVVDTQYGPVQGLTIELHNGIEVNSFYGIPFAEPPVGELRFRDPIVVQTPWDEVREAVELPSSCMQSLGGLFLLTHPLWNNVDEDCLNLNVFSPTNPGDVPYPVMVWLHGGAYQSSGNIQYPGHFLAMKDVVVVVPNYRLGHLGFAYTGDDNAPGNAGMKDQLMALEWVRENIANFGGDPDRVTIFGQSAGAGSSGLLMMSPQATGLFHQAILESGSEMAFWAVNLPESNPEDYISQVAESLDCTTDDNTAMMDCLREVPPRELIRTDFNCTDGFFCLGMVPVVDGPGGFLPDTPSNLRLNKNYNMVPEIIMHTAEDGMIYALAFLLGERWNISVGFTHEEFNEILDWAVGVFTPSLPDPSRKEDIFQAMSWFYSPWPYIHDPALNRYQVGMMVTDAAYGITADLQAKHHSQDSTTYNMIFGYKSDGFSDFIPEWLGVFHAMEIPYVFGLPYLPLNPDVRNNSGINIDVINYNDEDREYFDFIGDMWTNFAKFGNPTPSPVPLPGDRGDITWTMYGDTELNYMFVRNEVIEMRQNYRQQVYAFWSEYLRCMVLPDLEIPGTSSDCEGPVLQKHKGTGRLGSAFEIPRNPVQFNTEVNDIIEELFGGYMQGDEI